MEFRLSNPEWLYAAIVLVPLTLLGLSWFSSMGALRRWSAVLFRIFLFTLIVMLLAGASSVKRTDKFAAVLVVDTSGSMDRPVSALSNLNLPPELASRWATRPVLDLVQSFVQDASAGRGPDDLVGVVTVASQAAVVLPPTRAQTFEWPTDLPLGEGTNLEEGLRLARALLPPDAAGRIILVSDGVQTAGDVLAAARQTSSARAASGRGVVPISVVPIEYELTREVFIEAVDAPPRAAAGSTATVRVTLTATSPTTGTLRLLDDNRSIDLNGDAPGDGKRVTLAPGRNIEALDVPLGDGRVHRFRAVFEPDQAPPTTPGGLPTLAGDTLTRNNVGEGFTITPGQGSVLFLDGVNDGAGTTLSATLKEGGFVVDVRRGDFMPADLLQLGGYDLVVLENVPAEQIPAEKQALLVSYVKDLGGGLMMVGGTQSFGAGGWRGSQIEPILPVSLELPDKLIVPELAIAFVLDNSGSMNMRVMGSMRSQQEIANEAAALAVKSLDKKDLVGVSTFNESYEVLLPVSANTKPDDTAAMIRRIGSGGGTRAGPAMREAAEQLTKLEAKHKHIIVMSDGKSVDYHELPELCARLKAQGIQTSTISVGERGDPETMARMADQGGGAHYNVVNPEILPKIFLRAVRVVRSPPYREQPFEPRLAQLGSPLLAGVGQIGTLGGLCLTSARPEPTITTALVSDQNEPVLAHWQVELGRVAAFTSDASTWAGEWLKTPSYRKFWLQACRLTSRAEFSGSGLEARAVAADGRLTVRLEAFSGRGGEPGRAPMDGLDVPVTVYSPTGASKEIRLTQTGPGVYEGTTNAEEAGTYITLLRPRGGADTSGGSGGGGGGGGDRRLAPVVTGVSSQGGVEYRQLKSNADLLRQVAAESGGSVLSLVDPLSAKFFDRGGVKPLEVLLPIWKPLLAWTLALLLLDIATRRIAWDRWVSREFGESLAARAAHAVQERGTRAAATLSALRRADPPPETFSAEAPAASGYQPPVLTDRDALLLAKAAREQRRARGRQPETPPAPTPPQATPNTPTQAPSPGESGLLAAKRRAAERFKDDA